MSLLIQIVIMRDRKSIKIAGIILITVGYLSFDNWGRLGDIFQVLGALYLNRKEKPD